MSYTCIADATTNKASRYLNTYWYEGKSKALVPPAHLGLVPASLVTHTVDAVLGIFSGLATIFTVGKVESIAKFASKHIQSGDLLLTKPCQSLIKAMNPSFVFKEADDPGLLFPLLIKPLGDFGDKCTNEGNSAFKRHVISRLTFLLTAVVSIIVKLVDTIIGLLAFTLSLLALGRWKQINNFALNTLSSAGFMGFFGALSMVVRGPNE